MTGVGRVASVDGLRGFAAMAVVAYHLSEAAGLRTLSVPGMLLGNGNYGVEVFFVISGFVIALSVRDKKHTPGYFGRFVVRRVVRLDPPYWATLAVEIGLIWLGLQFFPDHAVRLPPAAEVGAHLVYLQDFLGVPQILPIFWTLCYEVQFYLVLVGSLTALHAVASHMEAAPRRRILTLITAAAFVFSLAIDTGFVGPTPSGLFVDRWYQFSLGFITLAVISGDSRWTTLVAVWSLVLVMAVVGGVDAYTAKSAGACVLTSGVLFASARGGMLVRALGSVSMQFLGRISYSLYLIHLVVGWRFVAVCLRLLPPTPTDATRIGLFIAGCLVSVLAAWLLYMLIEHPALRLARRLSQGPAKATAL